MRDQFTLQLRELLEKLMLMGGIAEEMILSASQSLREQNHMLGREVEAREYLVDGLQNEIDDRVVTIITQQQPVAKDARFVLVASRIATDLERIADQAVNICQNFEYVMSSPPADLPSDLPLMGEHARQMVADSLASLTTRELTIADKVVAAERKANQLRDRIFRTMLTAMITDPLSAQRSLSLILISRNYERICDHAVNIAQEVIYLVRGKDVRHPNNPVGAGRMDSH